MPIPIRNKDGSLSYQQTADEILQSESHKTIKQVSRELKLLIERVELLEYKMQALENANN